ncbi:MAG: hypothetical protein AAGH15_06305 [Myxococcota bacterium]
MRPLLMLALVLGCGDSSPSGDAGSGGDAGLRIDAGRDDAGADSGTPDSGTPDSGTPDSGTPDAGTEDAGGSDAGDALGTCDDGIANGDESDVDCGGRCGGCANGAACTAGPDCLSARCVERVCTSPEGTHPDIVRVLEVPGRNPGGRSWADSYSVGSECYCESTFDHAIGPIEVMTPLGLRTVREVCDALGPGPGSGDRPLYNDIQCGNGPPNDAGDEDDCPGRVDIGREGCGHVGPRWNLARLE